VIVFEVLKLAKEGVELLIGNLRSGVLVVKTVVTLQLGAESIDTLADSGFIELG
jgi:hypothetical protein